MSSIRKTLQEIHSGYGKALEKIYHGKKETENKNCYIKLLILPFQPQRSNLTGNISYVVGLIAIPTSFFIEYFSLSTRVTIASTIFIMIYLILIVHFRKRLCDWNDKLFHYDAFKKWRKSTFQIFEPLLTEELVNIEEQLIGYIDKTNREKENDIYSLKKQQQDIYKSSRALIDYLEKNNQRNEKMIEVTMTLLKSLIDLIESIRIGNGNINKRDLDFFDGFILYFVDEQDLKPVESYNPKNKVRPYGTMIDSANIRIKALTDAQEYVRTDKGYLFKYQYTDKTWLLEIFIERKELTTLRGKEFFDEDTLLQYLHKLYFATYPLLLRGRKRSVKSS